MATERPNKKAMGDALDIYRDAMRPFIVRYLRRVRGRTVEDAIKLALGDTQRSQFEQNLREGRSVEDSIDINDFPQLANCYWREVFRDAFKSDSEARASLRMIVTARNRVSHPGSQDMESEYVRARLHDITSVLKEINAPEAARDVEGIRDELFVAKTGADDSGPVVKTPRKKRTGSGPMTNDTTDQPPRRVVATTFAGYGFQRVGEVEPERDSQGVPVEYQPKPNSTEPNRYGHGPFCRFRAARGWRQSGVYVLASDGEPLYVGECKNLESVWRSYGRISRSAVSEGGNQTYCRINNRILTEANQRKEIILWFHAIADDKQRRRCKADLTNKLNPLENRSSSRSPH